MIYKENFKVGLKDIWKGNEVSNIAILEYLEDIAAYHSDSVGYGINTTKDTNLNWILLDWRVKVIKRPTYGENLEVHTWSRGIEKFWAFRDFEIYNDKKELCVVATSKWLLVSSKTEKIERVDPKMAEKYKSETEKKVFLDEELGKLKAPDHYDSKIEYTVRRKDIDVIGHMHNIYYLDLAYETLPEEAYQKRPFNNVRIMYKKEMKLGETVHCLYTKEEEKNIITIKDKDEKIIHAIIEIH